MNKEPQKCKKRLSRSINLTKFFVENLKFQPRDHINNIDIFLKEDTDFVKQVIEQDFTVYYLLSDGLKKEEKIFKAYKDKFDENERVEKIAREERERVEKEEKERVEKERVEKERVVRKELEDTLNFKFVLIKGGSFMMGVKDEVWADPVHRVEVRDFYISKTEVTVGQYRKCVEAGECSKPNSCNWTDSVVGKENHPINCVDWKQARTFAKWVGGDLPSEAQWEYASRSEGRDIKYPWGNTKATCKYAVMSENNTIGVWGCGKERTWEVCSKTGGNTVQGLCDMGGNVYEWVLDEWHKSYSGAPINEQAWCSDIECESNTSAHRVIRGGSWFDNASYLRSVYRTSDSPGGRYSTLGFRVSDIVP